MGRTLSSAGWPASLAAALALGCAADETAPDRVARDSAGVTIVENVRAAWEPGRSWTVSADPMVEIGVVDGPAEYQLYRAASAVRLSDGRIVVANGGTNELRFYDPAGRHLASVGRTGEGPGEFRDLQRVWRLPGDTLLAYDFFPARLSVLSPSGEFVRALHVAAPDGRQVLVRGPLDDGSLIAAGAPVWGAPGATTGVVRDSVPYYRYGPDGSLLDTLGFFPSVEAFRIVTGESWRLTSPPFPRAPVAAVAGDRFHFGPADRYEIRTYTPAGALERVIRMPHERRAVTPADLDRWRGERLERAEREGTRPAMERMLAELPTPERMPAYERLEVDAAGNLWVAQYRASGDEAPSWNVFSDEGQFLGTVDMPPGLEVSAIGSDFVLGRWRDELEVERIRMHALIKER